MASDGPAMEFDGIRDVLAAWRHELASLARARLGNAIGEAPGEIALAPSAQSVSLRWEQGDDRSELANVPRDAEHTPRAVRQVLSQAGGEAARRHDAVVVLAGHDVLRPTVRLPSAGRETLRNALRYELERLSPIPPDNLYFDFAVTARDPDANTADIALRIIRRDIVDDAVRLSRAAGLAPSAIRFDGDAEQADWRAFPVDRNARLMRLWRHWSLAILGAGAMVLLLALVMAWYLRGAAVLDALTDQVLSEGMQAARVEHLRDRIDQTQAQLAFLSKQKSAPSFAAILAEVTHTLPDGSWINQFDKTGRKVRIEGFSHAASDLIALFDRSGKFANAQFTAPVTQGPTPDVERFDLSFEIVGVEK
jgi:general secretion pathway protein L